MFILTLSPSRLLLVAQCLLHLLALLAALISTLGLHWQIVTVFLLMASLWQATNRTSLKSVNSIQAIEIDSEPSRKTDGEEQAIFVIVLPAIKSKISRRLPVNLIWFYCLAWIQLLAFRHQSAIYIAVIMPDSVDDSQRRELRAYLRSSACQRSLHPGN